VPPHAISPYYGQPMYPAPPAPRAHIEARVLVSLLASTIGLLLALIGLMLGATAVALQTGELYNGLALGVPALALGPLGYFLGKSAIGRIAESKGSLGGRGTAVTGWVIGVAASAVGATATLIWLVLVLVAIFGPPPA